MVHVAVRLDILAVGAIVSLLMSDKKLENDTKGRIFIDIIFVS